MKISKPAPKSMENIVRMLPSIKMSMNMNAARFTPVSASSIGGRVGERYDVHQQNAEQSDTSKRID